MAERTHKAKKEHQGKVRTTEDRERRVQKCREETYLTNKHTHTHNSQTHTNTYKHTHTHTNTHIDLTNTHTHTHTHTHPPSHTQLTNKQIPYTSHSVADLYHFDTDPESG